MFEEMNASDPSKAREIGEKFGNKFFNEDYLDQNI